MNYAKPGPSKNPLLQTLISMVGQSNVITVHRPLVDFLDGSLEGAMMLGQLLYWTPRSVMGGWVAKSDIDFQDELCLKRHSVRAARDLLIEKKLIETKLQKFNGFPTQHYRIRMDELQKLWGTFIASRLSENEQTDYPKTDNPLSENEQSLTETTTETTTETINTRFAKIQTSLEKIGILLKSGDPRIIDVWIEQHPDKWIQKAIDITSAKGIRNISYTQGILSQWLENGYPKIRAEKVQGANNAKNGTGNRKDAKRPEDEYSQADLDAAAKINARVR